jgi:hypothetical protein
MRRKDQVAGAVVPWAGERAEDPAIRKSRQTLLGERGTEQVAAEPLESGSIVGADGAIGVEVEAFEMGVAPADRKDPRRIWGGADAQHGGAGALAECRPAVDGGGTDVGEHGGRDGERIGFHVSRGVSGEHAPSSKQSQDARANRREEARHLPIGRRWRGMEARGAVRCGREHALQDERVEVDVQLDAAPETLDRRHRPAPAIDDPATAPAAALEPEQRAGVDREHGATERVVPCEAIAERVRQ